MAWAGVELPVTAAVSFILLFAFAVSWHFSVAPVIPPPPPAAAITAAAAAGVQLTRRELRTGILNIVPPALVQGPVPPSGTAQSATAPSGTVPPAEAAPAVPDALAVPAALPVPAALAARAASAAALAPLPAGVVVAGAAAAAPAPQPAGTRAAQPVQPSRWTQTFGPPETGQLPVQRYVADPGTAVEIADADLPDRRQRSHSSL